MNCLSSAFVLIHLPFPYTYCCVLHGETRTLIINGSPTYFYVSIWEILLGGTMRVPAPPFLNEVLGPNPPLTSVASKLGFVRKNTLQVREVAEVHAKSIPSRGANTASG